MKIRLVSFPFLTRHSRETIEIERMPANPAHANPTRKCIISLIIIIHGEPPKRADDAHARCNQPLCREDRSEKCRRDSVGDIRRNL